MQIKIEFNLVHVSGDVWEVFFEGKKIMAGSSASCKNLLEAFAEISRPSSWTIRVNNFNSPTGGRAGKGHAETPEATVANLVHEARPR